MAEPQSSSVARERAEIRALAAVLVEEQGMSPWVAREVAKAALPALRAFAAAWDWDAALERPHVRDAA